MRKALVFTAVAFLLGTTAAFAQDKPVDVNIGGGYTFALSDIRDHLGDGYNVNFGATFNLSKTIGIQGEYSFNGLGRKNVQIPLLPQPKGRLPFRDDHVESDVFADERQGTGRIEQSGRVQTAGAAEDPLRRSQQLDFDPTYVPARSKARVQNF